MFQRLNTEAEQVELSDSGDIKASGIQSRIPTNSGSYSIFTFKHTHEGDHMETIGEIKMR